MQAHHPLKGRSVRGVGPTILGFDSGVQDLLVPTLISEGPESLSESVRVSSGTPIKPMLAK